MTDIYQEHIREYNRKWYAANRKKMRAYHRRYYHENKERIALGRLKKKMQ